MDRGQVLLDGRLGDRVERRREAADDPPARHRLQENAEKAAAETIRYEIDLRLRLPRL
jgi:hypothetical protein